MMKNEELNFSSVTSDKLFAAKFLADSFRNKIYLILCK